jgi:hypothetical protein
MRAWRTSKRYFAASLGSGDSFCRTSQRTVILSEVALATESKDLHLARRTD